MRRAGRASRGRSARSRPLAMVEIAGKLGRELGQAGEAAMIDFATGWLADLYGADVKKAVGRTHATRWAREPGALGAFSAARDGGDRRQAWPRAWPGG